MKWRVVALGLIANLTMLTAFVRYEHGNTGVLFWAPAVTSLLAFAGFILLWRQPSGAPRRHRL